MITRYVLCTFLGMSSGCAVLHRAQLSDVEGKSAKHGTPVSVKVSETTLDFGEIAKYSKQLGGQRGPANAIGDVADTYTTYFQFGPRTGAPVFNEVYARAVPDLLMEKCPGGRVTDIISIRETRSYPVVKGEVVRVDATCVK